MKIIITVLTLLLFMSALGLAEDILQQYDLTLGIRTVDTSGILGKRQFPLKFQIRNLSHDSLEGEAIINLFFKGNLFVKEPTGEVKFKEFSRTWRTMIPSTLDYGESTESPVYADPIDFFKFSQSGRYLLWWQIDQNRSNVLVFDYQNGKLKLFESSK